MLVSTLFCFKQEKLNREVKEAFESIGNYNLRKNSPCSITGWDMSCSLLRSLTDFTVNKHVCYYVHPEIYDSQ